ncbi:5-formyltetrahydrofolate cyclo-ligase [uncultured Desulfuromonas sp.]|uniref:5-formyltetrahydrofolate cyclo-ligase n=1 Tax=uncultured Desulfuromonas sp. TaxID=181013 RepID=UPI002617C854|nr:5-formyltetrahydrofolate cyclo-ligase [uncultured Desulfuromonas sp.]
MPKTFLRGDLLRQRKYLSAETCLDRSRRLQSRFLELREFASAVSVALYSPVLNEVFTEEIFRRARHSGKRVAYPRVRGHALEFVEVAGHDEMRAGAFGVLEPTGNQIIPPDALDIVVVPGVGFDLAGHRLGYGKGFYDRYLHAAGRCRKAVGLAYEMQLVSELPAEAHDVRMHLLVTEERILRFSGDD